MKDGLVVRIFELLEELKLRMGDLIEDNENIIDEGGLHELANYEEQIDCMVCEVNKFASKIHENE